MFIVFVLTEAIEWSHPFLLSVIQIYIFYNSFRSIRPDYLSILNDRGVVPPPPVKALLYVHFFVSGGCQLCSLLYPVCQLHHICCVDAEEDVQDFRQLRPGLDSPQVSLSFLIARRRSERIRPKYTVSPYKSR